MKLIQQHSYEGFVVDIHEEQIVNERGILKKFFIGTLEDIDFYIRSENKLLVIDKFKEAVNKKEDEQILYGQEVLAQDLFNDMLYNYPEALPEVIEFLDKVQNKYKNQK